MLISHFVFKDPKNYSREKRKLIYEKTGSKVNKGGILIKGKKNHSLSRGYGIVPTDPGKDILNIRTRKLAATSEGRAYVEKVNKHNNNLLGKQVTARMNADQPKIPTPINYETNITKPPTTLSTKPSKVKKSILNRRNLAIGGGLLAAGGTAYGLHKLNQRRKTRSDKGKTRGRYRK